MNASLSNVLHALDNIAETSSKNEKERRLKAYVDRLGYPFVETVRLALNPFIRFNIRNVVMLERQSACAKSVDEIFSFLRRLSEKSGTSVQDLNELSVLASVDKDTYKVVLRILNKDLRCGIGLKTARKYIKDIPKFDVMLCSGDMDKFIKHVGTLDNAVWSYKVDGVRCWAVVKGNSVSYLSRNGKEYPNFSVFDDDILALSKSKDIHVFDGECVYDQADFQEQSKQVRRLHDPDMSKFVFKVFDIPSLKARLIDRVAAMRDTFKSVETRRVKLLDHFEFARSLEDTLSLAIQRGHEGLVVKSKQGFYELKRSIEWCKVKRTHSVDLKVLGWEYGTGKYEDLVGALVCSYKGREVRVGSGMSDEQREAFKSQTPEVVEVKYQEETKDGSLRFPVFVRTRSDKTG